MQHRNLVGQRTKSAGLELLDQQAEGLVGAGVGDDIKRAALLGGVEVDLFDVDLAVFGPGVEALLDLQQAVFLELEGEA